MAGKWGPSRNGCAVGIFFDDAVEISPDGSQARIKNVRLRFKSAVTVTESSNSWEWSGTAITDGSRGTFSFSGSGERTVQTLTGQWQNLAYGAETVVDFRATGSGVNYAGGDLTLPTTTFKLPARSVAIPAVPAGLLAGRMSDAQHQVAWTVTRTAAAPVETILVQRQSGSDTATPMTVSTLAGTANSWVDSSTAANSRYRWRAAARNSSGDSAWSAWSPWVATTPAAVNAGTISAVKAGSTISLGWVNAAPWRTATAIEHSTNSGASYTPETTAAAAAVSYDDTGLDVGVTHRYRLAHLVSGVPLAAGGTVTLTSPWATTATIQLSARPNQPLVSAPAVCDADLTGVMIGVIHQSVDSTQQTAGEVRWRPLGGSWTVVSLGIWTSVTIPAGTWTNGLTYEVQARTKGEHPDWSDWSASTLITTSGTPSVTILTPADTDTIGTSTAVYTWLFHDPDGGGQVSWEAELLSGALVVETASGSGATGSWTPQAALANSASYTGRIRGRDTDGLWSEWASVTNPVDFFPPPTPTIGTSFDPDEGSVEISVEVAPPTAGVEVEAVSATVERWTGDHWVVLVDRLPILTGDNGLTPDPDHPGLYLMDGLTLTPDGTPGLYLMDGLRLAASLPGLWLPVGPSSVATVDPIPPLSTEVTYRVTAWADSGASSIETTTVSTEGSCWSFLHAGPGWTVSAKIKANQQVGYTSERPTISRTFYGGVTKAYPAEATQRSWQISGDVATWPADESRIGGREPWDAIASMPPPVCIRTPLGHRGFGWVSAIPQQSQAGSPHTSISVTVSGTTHDE